MAVFVDTLYLLLPGLLVVTVAIRPTRAKWWVLGAVIAALGLAVLRKATNWINNEYLVLTLLVIGLCLVSMLAIASKGRRQLAARALTATILISVVPDTALAALAIVPGGETLLSATALANLAGYLGALALTAITCGCLARYALHRLARAGLLLLWCFQAVIEITKVVFNRGWLPKWPGLFDVLAWALNHRTALAWLMLGMACLACWPPRLDIPSSSLDAAQGRVRRAAQLSRRRFLATGLGAATLVVATGIWGRQLAGSAPTLSEPEPWEDVGNDVAVPLAQISDGHLHRFALTVPPGTEVRFIVIQKPEGAFGVGLDACNVCGPTGYYERDGQVICKMCEVAMNIRTIGFAGGCNPIPLDFRLDGGKLLVAKRDLIAAAEVF
ncbi:MAG: DUF2318 domain-containing protein [Propionibacteriaceae bacterium]|jgi:uncharacterized membrane protein|nr:DUF2318 domain-containing protein [Propionibacteriaceae bacterium]